MSTASGTVAQSAGGTTLTFTDTGSYGTIVSRNLLIYDANGNLLASVNMGALLAASINITADVYCSFVLTVVDNTGTYTATVNFLSTAFYDNTYVNTLAQLGCSCSLKEMNYIDISYFFRNAAFRLGLGGFGVAAQNNITAANTYISGT